MDIVGANDVAEPLATNPSIRILDLSDITFIDAAGLRLLIDAVRADPALSIGSMSGAVRRLVVMTGGDDIRGEPPSEGLAQPGTVPTRRRPTRVPPRCPHHRHP